MMKAGKHSKQPDEDTYDGTLLNKWGFLCNLEL